MCYECSRLDCRQRYHKIFHQNIPLQKPYSSFLIVAVSFPLMKCTHSQCDGPKACIGSPNTFDYRTYAVNTQPLLRHEARAVYA